MKAPGQLRGCKSALRALQLFDLFNMRRCPLSLKDIVQALRCPISSVDDLLKTLAASDYLNFDPVLKTYVPTSRRQDNWSWPADVGQHRIRALINRIHEQTGANCMVATANDLYLHRVDAVVGKLPADYRPQADDRIPLVMTGIGWAWIATCGHRIAEHLYRRTLAQGLMDRRLFDLKTFQSRIDRCRRDLCLSPSVRYPGTSVITTRLPQHPRLPRLFLAVTDQTQRLTSHFEPIAKLMIREVAALDLE